MRVEAVVDVAVVVLLVPGTALVLLGALGVVRMPDLYTRAQAAAKAAALGSVLVFSAAGLSLGGLGAVTKSVAIIVFAFLTPAVAAHVIVRAAHESGIPIGPPGTRDELRDGSGGSGREGPGPAGEANPPS